MSNLKNLIAALGTDQIQDLEDKARELLYSRDVDNCSGTQLDNLGTIIGQGRLGYDDEFYRERIEAIVSMVMHGLRVPNEEVS